MLLLLHLYRRRADILADSILLFVPLFHNAETSFYGDLYWMYVWHLVRFHGAPQLYSLCYLLCITGIQTQGLFFLHYSTKFYSHIAVSIFLLQNCLFIFYFRRNNCG